MSPFVEVTGLRKYFPVQRSFLESALSRKLEFVRAVDDVEFTVEKGETLGLVGESGSGKTTTGRLLLGLIEPTSGEIIIGGRNIVKAHPDELRDFRREAQMIFQDPAAALNPRMTIGQAIKEA